jgi:hypothetical protein
MTTSPPVMQAVGFYLGSNVQNWGAKYVIIKRGLEWKSLSGQVILHAEAALKVFEEIKDPDDSRARDLPLNWQITTHNRKE